MVTMITNPNPQKFPIQQHTKQTADGQGPAQNKTLWFRCTLVVQVALSGSTSLSSLCRTALGHSDDSRASIRNVSIYNTTAENSSINITDGRHPAQTNRKHTNPPPVRSRTLMS